MNSQGAAQRISSELNKSSEHWKNLALWLGDKENGERAISQLALVTGESPILFAAVTGEPLDVAFSAHLFTPKLLVSVSATGDEPSPVVTVVPRAALLGLDVLSAPIVTSGKWEGKWPLILDL
jgi:hypothetical protein